MTRAHAQAKAVAAAGVKRMGDFNRRTLDGLAARLYFYLSLAHERTGTLPQIRRCAAAASAAAGKRGLRTLACLHARRIQGLA